MVKNLLHDFLNLEKKIWYPISAKKYAQIIYLSKFNKKNFTIGTDIPVLSQRYFKSYMEKRVSPLSRNGVLLHNKEYK